MNTPARTQLARFQDAFARALLSPGAAPDTEVAALAAQPAFAVYRNTVVAGWIDALQANFPAVSRLMGEEWFRAAAAVYARAAPPSDPALLWFGESFPEFLRCFEPAVGLPYLPGVARLDRHWTEAHAAANCPVLDPALVAALGPAAMSRAVLHPHPASRWEWFPDAPVYTIWSRNRCSEPWDGELDWRPEGALITRPGDAVTWTGIDAAACAFLDACAEGATLEASTHAALEAKDDTDLAQLMSTLLETGVFSRISLTDEPLARECS